MIEYILVAQEMNTWLPEKRAKYNAKRRKKDLDFVYANWNLPKEMTEATINIADVPAKVAKKYKRAVTIHSSDWAMKDEEYCVKHREMVARGDREGHQNSVFHHATSILVQMHRVLPTYQLKTIIDVLSDFRSGGGGKGGASNYRYWVNHRLLAFYNHAMGEDIDDELCPRHSNKALSLLPKC